MNEWKPGQQLAGLLAVCWGFAAAFNDNAADMGLIVVIGICFLAGAC